MTRPNIILIFTDNQQAETLACYGNTEVHTPNLDALARAGTRFDNAFCANAFCSPCRASALTGLLPSQHGVHSWLDDRNSDDWPDGWHALGNLPTLPKLLKEQGYTTGLFGKYHLGDPTAPADGWDSWVTMADGHVRSFYDNRIYDNGTEYAQPGHSVDFFTDKMLAFTAQAQSPYFAYLPLPAPYGHWPATNDGNRNRHADRYDDCPMHSVPREGLSAETIKHFESIRSQSSPDLDFTMLLRAPNDLPTLRNYYSQITMIDDAVGRIMKAAPDALIIFTADHGLSLGHHGFWGHGNATHPSNLHRAAHSIPMIVKRPDGGGAGQTTDAMVSNLDLFATILECAGASAPQDVPSRSLMPLLTGDDATDFDEVFSEQEETRVIRTRYWVLFKRYNGTGAPPLPHALYDVQNDRRERVNLAADPAYGAVVADLCNRIDAYFERHANPAADLWRGGVPIQNSSAKTFWKSIWGAGWQPIYAYETEAP